MILEKACRIMTWPIMPIGEKIKNKLRNHSWTGPSVEKERKRRAEVNAMIGVEKSKLWYKNHPKTLSSTNRR